MTDETIYLKARIGNLQVMLEDLEYENKKLKEENRQLRRWRPPDHTTPGKPANRQRIQNTDKYKEYFTANFKKPKL